MILVAVSQRVMYIQAYRERRDELDQRWASFLSRCGILALPIPNQASVAALLLNECPVAGVLLTGGGDLRKYGGDTPERDETEAVLIRFALEKELPLLGVCRGMQCIQDHFGVRLHKIQGHVTSSQVNIIEGVPLQVNSYHCWGTTETVQELEIWAKAEDDVVKAVRHRMKPVQGMMWHPERMEPFADRDILFFRNFFG